VDPVPDPLLFFLVVPGIEPGLILKAVLIAVVSDMKHMVVPSHS
jgi:hypothetical protein